MEQSLGKRIVSHRKRLGLTQDQLAEKLGVTAQAVSKWENDQSCPDISVLPLLADIFGISTDELLGRDHHKQPIQTEEPLNDGKSTPNNSWAQQQKSAIGLAALVLLVGGVYLASSIFSLGLSFWEILWPSALLIFGAFSLLPKFSFVSLSCVLFGGYMLITKLLGLQLQLHSGILWSILLLLFGISILADALHRKRTGSTGPAFAGHRSKNSFHTGSQDFSYEACFCEDHRQVQLTQLTHGQISVSFGEFSLDLCGVDSIRDGCMIEASCGFGALTLRVPQRFRIQPESSTAFAAFNVTGTPAPQADGIIQLNARVSFGEIRIIYI